MRSFIVGICVLCIFGFVASHFAIQNSNSYEECKAERHAEDASPNAEKHAAYVIAFACEARTISENEGIVTAIATIYIAVFTLFLGVATLYLWGAGERQLKQSRESSERQLRAYVAPQGREITDIQNEFDCTVTVEIKNYGQTPAHDVTVLCGVIVHPLPFDEVIFNFDPGMESASRYVLHPGEIVTVISHRRDGEPREITNSELADIFGGKKVILVFGKVFYKDAFDVSRETGFFYRKDATSIDGTKLVVCKKENYAT